MTSPRTTFVAATRLIPWWWLMYDRTTVERRPGSCRDGVKSIASYQPKAPSAPSAVRRLRFSRAAAGSTIVAIAVAYGATTQSWSSPCFSPRPGVRNAW